MRKVLASLKPYYYYLVGEGIKKIEVRKDMPKASDWDNEVLFYMSKDEKSFAKIPKEFQGKYRKHFGKVGMQFICDRIICSQAYFDSQGKNHLTNVFPEDIKKTCLTEYDLWDYIAGKAVKANQMYDGYLWRISDLKIYDKPRNLNEFRKPCDWNYDCCTCKRAKYELTKAEAKVFYGCDSELTRPPQSWMYIEGLREE